MEESGGGGTGRHVESTSRQPGSENTRQKHCLTFVSANGHILQSSSGGTPCVSMFWVRNRSTTHINNNNNDNNNNKCLCQMFWGRTR